MQMKSKEPQSTKLVRIRAKTTIASPDGTLHSPGEEIELPENVAEGYLAPIEGPYNFDGERSTHAATKASIIRAERVA